MGNCCGKGGSRRQSRELAKAAAAGNGMVIEPELAIRVHTISEEPDGVPLSRDPTPLEAPSSSSEAALTEDIVRHLSSIQPPARVQYFPPKEWSTCAYCGNPNGDRYGYFFCSSMSPHLLDTLMENGWWRTGKILFKPCFPLVCCPGYALRLPVAEFQLKKKHRRVIRRWARFLRHGDSRWDNRHETSDTRPSNAVRESGSRAEADLVQAAVVASVGGEVVGGDCEDVESEPPVEREAVSTATGESNVSQGQGRERRTPTPGRGADPSKPPCRKAKLVRVEKRLENRGSSNTHSNTAPTQPSSLHDLLADHRLSETSLPEFKHRLKVRLLGCNPCHPDLIRTLQKAYELYDKFQESVHRGKTRFKSAEEFQWGFMNSPIVNPPTHLEGSYHMHYYIDDELVMISILDILPKYFVSIYFIYDPAIRFMTPGIYTVLVELDLLQQLQSQHTGPRPRYYALGYYNCNPKVSYKAQFKPQEVLCNETHTFVRMDTASEKLSEMVYTRLAGDRVPEKPGRATPLDNLVISFGPYSGAVQYQFLHRRLKRCYTGPLRELVAETGPEAAQEMIISTSITP